MAFPSPISRFRRPALALVPAPHLLSLLRWLLISAAVGGLVGSASAGFLVALDWVTAWREAHPWVLWLLPAGGLVIEACYHYLGFFLQKGGFTR